VYGGGDDDDDVLAAIGVDDVEDGFDVGGVDGSIAKVLDEVAQRELAGICDPTTTLATRVCHAMAVSWSTIPRLSARSKMSLKSSMLGDSGVLGCVVRT